MRLSNYILMWTVVAILMLPLIALASKSFAIIVICLIALAGIVVMIVRFFEIAGRL